MMLTEKKIKVGKEIPTFFTEGKCCTTKPIHHRIQATREVVHVAFVLPTIAHATHKALLLYEK